MKKEFVQTLIFLIGITLIVFFLSGCQRADQASVEIPENAKAGDIVNLEACVYERGDVEYAADCGTLVVPENRNDPNSRLVSVPVTRVRSIRSNPTESIFFLPGGPGLSNISTSRVNWFIEKYDVVILGYRGVDGSARLDCPEVSQHIKNLPGDMLGEVSMGEDDCILCPLR